jgi:dolichol-phosphate mannosyltransferase
MTGPSLATEDWCVPAYRAELFHDRQHDHVLVIPVINEGQRIRAQLQRLLVERAPVDVVVADGGSTDGSLAADFIAKAGVRALLVKTGPGRLSAQLRMAYSWSLRQGYAGIVTIDGNGKDNVDAVAGFVAALRNGYDYVQGSRYVRGGLAENTPLERTIGNRLIHAPLMSLAGRHWFTDTTNGFRGYSSRFLLDPRVAPFRDVFVDYELLFYLTARAGQLGYRVCEIPVRRSYPLGVPTPTKISGLAAKASVMRQLLNAVLGKYRPKSPEAGG